MFIFSILCKLSKATKSSGVEHCCQPGPCLGLGRAHSRLWGYPQVSCCVAFSAPQDTGLYTSGLQAGNDADVHPPSSAAWAAGLLRELIGGPLKDQHHPMLPCDVATPPTPQDKNKQTSGTALKCGLQLATPFPLQQRPPCLPVEVPRSSPKYAGCTQLLWRACGTVV